MAGEFGRSMSDLGAGLMARSERRRELEDQRKYAEEQRKREEEAFARKQKVLADIKAEQEKAKEAARIAREREKVMQPKLMNVPGVGLVDTRRGEDGSVSMQTLLQAPQSDSGWSKSIIINDAGEEEWAYTHPSGGVRPTGLKPRPSSSGDDIKKITIMQAQRDMIEAEQLAKNLRENSEGLYGSAKAANAKAAAQAEAKAKAARSYYQSLTGEGSEEQPPVSPTARSGILGTVFGGFQDAFGRVREAGGDVGLASMQAAAEGAISPQSAADASSLATSGPARVSYTDPKTGEQVEASSNEGTVVQEINLLWAELKRKYPDADPDKLYQIASKRVRGS